MRFSFRSISAVLFSFLCLCKAYSAQDSGDLTVSEANSMILSAQSDFQVIDVRTPEEFRAGHIRRSENIDFYADNFSSLVSEKDRDKTYLLYCRSGRRSKNAQEIMKKLGFITVYNMLGGINAWAAAGFPVTTEEVKTLNGDISAEEAFQKLMCNCGVNRIDLRNEREFIKSHIDKAFNFDFYADDFYQKLEKLAKDRACVVYCKNGEKGAQAMEIMVKLGFMEVFNISGGFDGWTAGGYPVVSE